MLVLLGGVSGAGKDTVKNEMIRRIDNVISIPSYTSREKREGEIPGVTYYYVTTEEFEKMIKDKEFLEYDYHHDHYYGTSKKIILNKIKEGKIIIKDIDVNGIENIKKSIGDKVKIITIFLRVPRKELERRLRNREDGLTEEQIQQRLGRLEYEESKIPTFNYVVDNIDLDKTFSTIEEIIRKEAK